MALIVRKYDAPLLDVKPYSQVDLVDSLPSNAHILGLTDERRIGLYIFPHFFSGCLTLKIKVLWSFETSEL